MQQPMMLDNILKLCQKEHPSFSACKTACAKARGRRGLRALERHRVPFCVYSARPTPVRGAWAAQVGQIVMQVNNSKNAHNSNILQVILRDHGFHKTEPPDTDWNVFWCAGQARAGCSLSAPPPSHRLVILPSLHLLLAPNCAVDIACASLPRGRWIRSRCARSSPTRR